MTNGGMKSYSAILDGTFFADFVGSLPQVDYTYRNYIPRFAPEPIRIRFNDPATIVWWEDGDKTVVKCRPGEEFDPEVGFAMAYMKKIYGSHSAFKREIVNKVK